MMIRDHEPDMDQSKTLKVTLPTRMHLKLHQLKILAGKNISTTVEEALDEYFEQYREGTEASHEPERSHAGPAGAGSDPAEPGTGVA